MENISSRNHKAKYTSPIIKNYYSEAVRVQNELNVFNMIPLYYKACSFDDYYSEDILSNISNCNALKLAKNIISLLSKPWNVEKGNILPEIFYKQIVTFKDTNSSFAGMDKEIVEIYYRQSARIMNAAGMIKHIKGKIFVDLSLNSDIDIYFALLKAFWNLIEWEQIFPSNIDMAKSLHHDRGIFKDILLKEKKMDVQSMADYFSDLTGISNKGDLFLASFLDFYLLKWLEHFNLVKYQKSLATMPVSFEISGVASEIFEIIS